MPRLTSTYDFHRGPADCRKLKTAEGGVNSNATTVIPSFIKISPFQMTSIAIDCLINSWFYVRLKNAMRETQSTEHYRQS
jgi:hypothetical protein